MKLNKKNNEGNIFIPKVSINIIWLLFEKVLRLGIGVLIFTQIARYLQADDFGLLSYSMAIVSIFIALSTIGLNGIVVRDLINMPESSNTILGTALALRLTSSFLAYLALIILIKLIKPNNIEEQWSVILLGLILLFKSAEIIKLWFESQVTSKYVAWTDTVVLLIVSTLNILLIYLKMPFIAFVYALIIESIVLCVLLFYIYIKKVGQLKNWKISLQQAKKLLKESWPLIISSTAWIIYTRVDQVMLGNMLDNKAVGLYSAATKLSESIIIFPTIVAFSIIPTIMSFKEDNNPLYLKRFQSIYDITIIPMLMFALGTTLLSKQIISFLYGESYEAASIVLSIHIWSIIFITMAIISGKFLINEGLQKITMHRHLVGLIINILLNYFFIPIYGIEGAALASLLSLVISNYLLDALRKETKILFQQKTRALFFISVFRCIRSRST